MELLGRLATIIFPKRCAYCGEVISEDIDVCDSCRKNVKRIKPPICVNCGTNKKDCTCKKHKRAYKAVCAPFYYEGIAKKAVKRFKFDEKTYIAKVLGQEMSKCADREFKDINFDIITCVPMTEKGIKSRGFNQSALLAKELKIKNNPVCDVDLLVKLYDVPAQHTLDAKRRTGNVFGIFDLNKAKDVEDKTILLCDDIKTTGSTANECAGVLLSYGAKEVYLICAAITSSKKDNIDIR